MGDYFDPCGFRAGGGGDAGDFRLSCCGEPGKQKKNAANSASRPMEYVFAEAMFHQQLGVQST
jgi:hypothetical protein